MYINTDKRKERESNEFVVESDVFNKYNVNLKRRKQHLIQYQSRVIYAESGQYKHSLCLFIVSIHYLLSILIFTNG